MNSLKTTSDQIAQKLKILSVNTRIQILKSLGSHSLCVGALARQLQITQGAVSQHLRILRSAGLVVAHRCGYYIHYRLNREELAVWAEDIDELFSILTKESLSIERESPCVTMTQKTNVKNRKT